MLSLIYSAIQRTLKYLYADETEDINEVISRIEAKRQRNVSAKPEEALNGEGCYYRTGSITKVATDYVLIDDNYMYEKNDDLSINLKVGDKVYYLAYLRDPNAEPKIRKIISVLDDESWDAVHVKTKRAAHNQVIPRSIIARVTKREGRIAIVEPNNVRIDLSKVQSDFIPLIGDWLILESLVELSNSSTDLSGEILEVDRIKPLRSKLDVGVISKYDLDVGIIDRQIIFHKQACEPGYIPCIGDKVVSDSIESDQGQYTWRSITVVPLNQAANKSSRLPAISNLHLALSNTNDLLENKNDIVIDDDLKFTLNIEEESVLIVMIQNNSSDTHILQGGSFLPQETPSQLSLVVPDNTDDDAMMINPSENVMFTFKCKAKFVGISEELFIFNFKDFKIGRLFHIIVNAKDIPRKTDPTSVTQNKSQRLNMSDLDELNEVTYIPGVKPCKPPAFIKVRSGMFKVPRYIWNAVLSTTSEKKSQMECEIAVADQIPCLLKSLSFATYKDHFHTLLYLEEIAQTLNLQQYSMESAIMRRYKDYLVLQVPGLAEKRPSLLVGDRAVVSFQWDSSQGKLKYEGFIHQVTSSEIFLKFNEKFHHDYNNEDCQVTFKYSQTTMNRYHDSVNLAINRLRADLLFPTKVLQKEPQFHLEECEIEEKPTRTRISDKRNNSTLNNNFSSSNSIASESDTSDNVIKMSPRVSVAERLFNVKPIETLSEGTKISATRVATNPNQKTNLMKSDSKTDVASTTVTRETNQSIAKTDNELEPYITQIKKRKLNWFNEKLNYYQREAVRNILKGLGRPLPYVIFGPPGTGKTMTLCEAILQIVTVIPESRLLVATPSNSSANLIAERLLESNVLKPGDLVRLIAYHCLYDGSIPERLLPYCATADLAAEGTHERKHHQEEGPKMNCTMSVLGRHRITVGTCNALGILYNMGFPRGHFSHVLVDEAGQATEPEILIPLNFIHSDYGQVILAGDPMQLGPVVQSKLAQHFGLGESYLSRLLHQFPYQRDLEGFEAGYDSRLVTKLIINYRSLPEILDLPNSLFYESELQSHISPTKSEEAELLEALRAELPTRDHGSPPAIVFHGVKGENYRDSESPSWYNPQEATQVYLYLLKLYQYGLEPDDIGIITPYQKQVLQIRDLLLEIDMKLPKISSVEGFQGQERKVIILSTVRSCNNLIDDDIKHALGFVASPRRLNVAITRARALLIILGNPELLALDPYWRSVLIYCIDRGAYTGCNFLPSYITDLQNVE
ncbi:hypothetical protein DMN91_005067 [Ooceraea biroi]|uniref:RNA helicase n=1 Tax=Ooceraea biroi TaxID=2015173 RepID=A0A026VXA3_OOCBI|nr:RNA helicase Mov10l1 [Ooceraea biroi]EZA47489.1 Putative helicase Mov10l1 [Ooceraea biroi]RLU22789.1 hypothetical protein DMN91_005067 [Ooceraea biroi]